MNMNDLSTPSTPRPSVYSDACNSTSRIDCGRLYDLFQEEFEEEQRLQDMHQAAKERRQKKYVYRFIPSSRAGGGTSLRVCFNPKTHNAISILEKNADGKITDMPANDVTLLIEALRVCRIFVDVSTALSPIILERLRNEAIHTEEIAKYRRLQMNGGMQEDDYSLASLWKNDLMAEMRRVNGFEARSGDPQWPTQHARLSASSRVLLRNVLSKETLKRTFVSLRALSLTVVSEVADFLKLPARDADRKAVVQQIKDAFAATAGTAASKKKTKKTKTITSSSSSK